VYDVDAEHSLITAAGSRAQVDAADIVMLTGLIISGTQPQQFLVKALGASLANSGIAGVLVDPVLSLTNANGMPVTSNDDWKSAQQSDIAATGLAPTNNRESALVTMLAPGNYTAKITGKNGATGIAFFQSYELPYSSEPLNPAPGARPVLHAETEALAIQTLGGATHSVITDATLSGGAGTRLNATASGQYVTYNVP